MQGVNMNEQDQVVVDKLGRQGDVLLRRVMDGWCLPSEAKLLPREQGRIILAHGTATGHSHAVVDTVSDIAIGDSYDGHAQFFEAGDMRYLRIPPRGANLVHDEHATIALAAGDYVVIRQRETDGDTDRQVED
jgi:hypothetical protein